MTKSTDNNVKQLESVDIEQQPVQALDAALTVLNQIEGDNLIVEWNSEQSALIYLKYLSNLEKYDGKSISASKAYFNDHLNGKMVNTKIGPVRINSKSRGKIHDRMRDVKFLAIPYIPEVLMTGDVSELIPLNKERTDSVVGYYNFEKSKDLKGFTLKITLKVALDSEGNLLYFLGASKEKANLRTVSHAQGTTGSKVGFDSIKSQFTPISQVVNPIGLETGFESITSQDDDEINLDVQILDKDGNTLSDDEAEKLLLSGLSINDSGMHSITGRTNTVKTAKGTKLETVFALVEADNVIASHDSTGGVNPKFPQELQPRDRSRDTSQAWVQKTAGNLDPDSLGKTGRADTGAPIVGPDLVVESGNGRTMAIQLAYARGTADEYRAWLVEEAAYFGFKPEQVKALSQPVLVRIRKTEVDRAAFAVEANQDDKLSFSATERAKSDARRIDGNMAMLFNPSEDGDLTAASNVKFIQAFLRSLGDTEAAQYTTTDGKPTQALVSRIKAAVFSKAYNDDRLLEMVADQAKPDLQNMLNALSVAAPKFIEAQALDRVKAEDLSSKIVDGMEQAIDKQVINAIIDAANVVMTAKNDNQDVAEFVKQQGLFGDLSEGVPELAVFLAKNSRSAKKMSLLFKAMAEYLEKQAFEQSTIGLFGDPEPVKMQDVIQYATSVIEHEYGDKANLNMFDNIGYSLFNDQLSQINVETDPIGALEICLLIFSASEELSDDPNSPNYRYRDTGYIADSRKELAANNITVARKSGIRLRATDIDWEAIETNPRQAADLIIKANLFGKTDWQALQDAGMEAAAGFLIDKIYASIAPEPTSALPALNFLSSNDLIKIAGASDTDALAQTRKDYARGLETIRDRLENKLTVTEVLQVITEIRDEINGIQLTSEQATQLDQLKDQLQEKQANLRELKGKNDTLFKDWYAYDRKIGSLQYEQTKRLNRKWKPDPEIAKQISELKVLAEEADKTYKEWRAAHPELESKERGDGTWISYDNDLEYEIRLLREQASKIKKLAQFNNLVFNPSTRAWLVMGERFLNMLNYRSYSGSDSFAGHVTNAKAGKIKDWSWADKTKPKTSRTATKQEISFQLKVADTYERVGGKAVVAESTQALENMLGLRAVQSGNWVLKDPNSAKFHVENTAAAMSDLSDILGIDTNLLGFGGRLGLAFGARGVGGKDAAAAHYESVHRVINLTKMRGGGALGHEWFHSMDNMLHEMVRQEVNGGKREFVTLDPALLPKGKIQDAVVALKKAMFEGTVRPLQQMIYTAKDVSQAKYNIDNPRNNLSRAIKQAGNAVDAVIVLKEQFAGRIREKDFKKWLTMAIAYYHEGTTEVDTRYEKILKVGDPGSSFAAEAIRLDEGIAERYWSRHHEMAARAFQSYLEDSLATQNRRNDYLSALADNKHHYDPLFDIQYNPYPEGEERIRINAAFDKLFAAIRDEQVFQKAVGNKELMDSMFPNVSFTGLALEPAC